MKKITLFFLLLLLATSCATVGSTTKTTTTSGTDCPVFYTGRDEPAASDRYIYSEHEQ
jgi:uncharacterized protein YceK